MPISITIILIIALANILLGFVVYTRNKSLFANKVFIVFTFMMTVWMLSNYFLSLVVSNVALATFLNGLAYTVGFLTVFCAFIFSQSYPVESSFVKSKIKLYSAAVAAILFSVFSATSPVTGGVLLGSDGRIAYGDAPLELVYSVASLVLMLGIFGRYIFVIKKLKGAERSQAISIMLALGIGISVALLANLVLPLIDLKFDYGLFAPISSLIAVALIAYAITRHGLFDVRPFIARSLGYLLSIAVLILVFLSIAIAASKSFFGSSIAFNQVVFFAALSILTALLFQPIKYYFDKASNKLFFRDSYNPQEVINKVNSKLVNTLDLSNLLESTALLIENELKVTYCVFSLDSKASTEHRLVDTDSKLFESPAWSTFSAYFDSHEENIFQANDMTLPDEVKGALNKLDIEIAIKMKSNGEKVGHVIIGPRKSGNSFTNQDIQLLEIIAGEVAIAAQNALRFEEIAQFNVELEKKIDDATSKLQRNNEKLKALDEAKDEFISMASHQLRTPLTSVKGYISMILEGDAGKVTDQQRLFLDQAFISSQRMVYLIADLLNVSRLKTGKFVIEAKPTYLPDVIESEISQLYETAKSRGLKLVFNKPKEYPTLNLDETKVRQVIMNFTDNAIYYTPKGGKITLDLTVAKGMVEFTVHDTGIGVPKSEQPHLFTKFYRAGNAKKARPDGTGLGLFMAKKVIVAQGGAIIFKTEEGKGSTFGFTFPRAKLETPVQ